MKFHATLISESRKPESVSKALDVDNIRLSGLEIATRISGSNIETSVGSDSLPTLLSTLDDLIKCQIMAEGLI